MGTCTAARAAPALVREQRLHHDLGAGRVEARDHGGDAGRVAEGQTGRKPLWILGALVLRLPLLLLVLL